MTQTHDKPVINVDDVELAPFGHGEAFAAKLGSVGTRIGMEKLGCLLHVVEPGKSAFPFHAHHVNEEMFVILDGRGEYRWGGDRHAGATGRGAGPAAGGRAWGPERRRGRERSQDKDSRGPALRSVRRGRGPVRRSDGGRPGR